MINALKFKSVLLLLFLCLEVTSYAQQVLSVPLTSDKLILFDVISKNEVYNGKEAIVLQQPVVKDNQKTFALLKDIDFHNGTIEIFLAGQPRKDVVVEGERGFVGIFFRVRKDTSKFE